MKIYHLVVYVPVTDAEQVRAALAEAGAGRIGNYDACSFSVRGTGRFRPNANAKPYIGSPGGVEEVEEERIEVVVTEDVLTNVLWAVKRVHPYEEPAVHLWPMLDYKDFLGGSSGLTTGAE